MLSFDIPRSTRGVALLAALIGAGCAAMDRPPDGAIDSAVSDVDSAGALSDGARVEDSVDGRAEACPGVPSGFACEGDTWALCDLGEAWRVDCRMPYRGASPGRCRLVSSEHGYACVVPTGGGCRMEVPHGTHSHVFITACEGPNSGCLISERGSGFEGTCVADLGACSVEDVDVCRGQRLVTRCLRGQPVATDCAALGGRCSPGSCVELPAGAPCGSSLRCRDGLRCARASRRELFRCVAEGDAGADGL